MPLRKRNGAGTITKNGYVLRREAGGPQIYEHIRVVERAMGKKLPKYAVIHHLNGDKTDNSPSNLVVCPSEMYHKLLHRRAENFNIVF